MKDFFQISDLIFLLLLYQIKTWPSRLFRYGFNDLHFINGICIHKYPGH